MGKLIGRDLLKLSDINRRELLEILLYAKDLKKSVKHSNLLKGKTLTMLFAKSSTRTRVSFEIAMAQLGGHPLNLNWDETNFLKGDITDEARSLGIYSDVIMTRVFTHDQTIKIADGSGVPVINGMDNLHHPCQALADLLTIYEAKGKFDGIKIGWVGDGTNVCNSLSQGAELLKMKMTIASPKGYEPNIVGLTTTVLQDCREAAKNADVLVTDSWVSLGLENEKETRLKVFKPYQLNSHLLSLAKKDCIVMHCLPAQRGYEITSEVMDSPKSWIFTEAENRLHTEKALLLKLLRR